MATHLRPQHLAALLVLMPSACAPLPAPCAEAAALEGRVTLAFDGALPRARLLYAVARDDSPIELTVTQRTRDHGATGKLLEQMFVLELRRESSRCYRVELEDQHFVDGARAAHGALTLSREGWRGTEIVTMARDKADDAIAHIIRTTLEELPIVLPSQPVGVGALWTLARRFGKEGLGYEQRIDYRLDARQGDLVVVSVGVHAVAAPQFDMRPGGATLQPLERAEEHGVGRFTVNLSKPLPRGSLRLERTIVKTTQAESQTFQSTVEILFDVADP
jgi:hypothetical protein